MQKKQRYWSIIESVRTHRAVIEKFKTMQMLDVHFPTTDNRVLILSRYTQPGKDQKLLPHQLKLALPEQVKAG